MLWRWFNHVDLSLNGYNVIMGVLKDILMILLRLLFMFIFLWDEYNVIKRRLGVFATNPRDATRQTDKFVDVDSNKMMMTMMVKIMMMRMTMMVAIRMTTTMTLVTLISVKITMMLTIYHEVFNDMKNGGSWGNDNYNYNEDDNW